MKNAKLIKESVKEIIEKVIPKNLKKKEEKLELSCKIDKLFIDDLRIGLYKWKIFQKKTSIYILSTTYIIK